MMNWLLATLVAAVLLPDSGAVAAAAVAPSKDPAALNDTAWLLAALPGLALVPDAQVTVQFSGGTVDGSDGCNRYRAAFSLDKEGFRVSGPIASTQMACPEPVMAQAKVFVDALSAARAVRIDKGELVLLDADGKALATLAPQDRDLPGTAWQVTGYNNGRQAVVSVLDGPLLTLAFAADGGVSGSAGCNGYRAPFKTTGQSLSIGPVAATRKVCDSPPDVMEQEAAFLKALEQVATVRVDGDRIELRAADGALMVMAARISGRSAAVTPEAPQQAVGVEPPARP